MFVEHIFYKSAGDEHVGPLNLHENLNVIFGRNGAGKTRTLNVLFNLGLMHRLPIKFIGTHNIIINEKTKKYYYEIVTKNAEKGIVVENDSLYEGQVGEKLIFDRSKNLLLDETAEQEVRYSPISNELSIDYVKDTEKHKTALKIKNFLIRIKRLNFSMNQVLQLNSSPDILSISPDGTDLDIAMVNIMDKYPQYFERIKSCFVDIFPQVENILAGDIFLPNGIKKRTVFIKESWMKGPYPYFEAASGMTKILAVLTLLFSPEESPLVLIDELENSLDYDSIVKIADIIKEACLDKQIIIVTHSPILASRFDLKYWIIAKRENLHVKFFNIRIDKKLKELLNTNIENYSLYTQDLLNLEEHK